MPDMSLDCAVLKELGYVKPPRFEDRVYPVVCAVDKSADLPNVVGKRTFNPGIICFVNPGTKSNPIFKVLVFKTSGSITPNFESFKKPIICYTSKAKAKTFVVIVFYKILVYFK